MVCANPSILAYAERYLLAKEVTPEWARTMRAYVRRFCAWAGCEVPIHEVSSPLVNAWLASLAGMNPWTLANHRCAIVAVWRYAYEEGDNDHPPLRVRRVRKPPLLVEAYSHVEIRALLRAAASLSYVHCDGRPAALFWQAAIHLAYSCGSRRGDLLKLRWQHVQPNGVVRWAQSKTKYLAAARLSRQSLYFARRLAHPELVLPWPYKLGRFCGHFNRMRDAAGVTRGTFRWLRRSAGSFAEREQAGNGARLLGHRDPGVFKRHYQDDAIVGELPPEVPPLG
jgi:integrase